MKRINILNEDTANKIAAGEVVERPCSVVKELVENSIDANSKNILIEIEEGGINLIRIVDDGDGIYKDDISKAFLPHATSKIKLSEDIYSISTLGFRGEALPSIASVSKVNLKSKQQTEEYGYEISIEGGTFSEVTECGINKGTILEVRDLFFNVPARKKFLKTTSKETSLITDIITRIALSHPNISFKLFNNGKKILHTYGNGNIKDVIRTIYNKSISDNIVYFEDTSDLVTIYGYVGKEEIARGSRNNQSIFVNNRYIKNRSLGIAIEQAFKSFSTSNKFPFFILFVDIYPEYIDVNIHPTKAEIKFNDERFIFKKIFGAVHTALKEEIFDTFAIPEEKEIKTKKNDLTIEEITFKIEEEKEKVQANKCSFTNKTSFDIVNTSIIENNKGIYSPNEEKSICSIPIDLKSDHNDLELEINNKNMCSKVQKSTLISEESSIISGNKETSLSMDNTIVQNCDNINIESNMQNSIKENTNSYITKPDNIIKNPKFPAIRIIGQYNKTYVLGEHNGTLYMIDQHAAHEKILFEKYLKEISQGEIIIQPLMVPTLIDLSIDDYSYFEENKDVFKSAGFTIDEFGGTSIALKEVPYFLGKLNPKSLFLDIIDNLKNLGSGKTTEVKYNTIATKACKSAVKGNDSLDELEMAKLIEELRYIDDPFHCPHGRPTIIQFTSTDIDKKFRRIV
ncbi:DNA mismatch repair endonuclease MutL [Clostridium weizhouense]|uniref:DNA mismatch repair protein MutL n=1 Tax=Clostridium weizhouense TaxID=2859781 RepID=A0ABS7ALU1_9CLOT|nr:DNA mismatch repair endonuclease MutL [Clostridium weizhouense]MBW6409534.1 DNA mismatch repair endonuclease MutL [Clostridium weizhouense]